MMMILHLLGTTIMILLRLEATRADYKCLCVFDNHVHTIYQKPNVTSQVFWFLPPNQCKYFLYPVNAEFAAIMVFHQKGFIHMATPGMIQTCDGYPSLADILTTTMMTSQSTSSGTSPKAAFISTVTSSLITKPAAMSISTSRIVIATVSNISTSNSSTSRSTKSSVTAPTSRLPHHTDVSSLSSSSPLPSTTVSLPSSSNAKTHDSSFPTSAVTLSTKSSTITEGHIEVCPAYIKNTDVNQYNGFLGQYGDLCYELVNVPTRWQNAERHCASVPQGHLVHILNQGQQDYLVRFLGEHHYVKGIWIGLTDSYHEGTWRWSSGATYHYNNFHDDYAQHSASTHWSNDCGLFKQGGEWTDDSCGISVILGLRTHPYVCQYNISTALPSIIDALPNEVVG